MRQRKRPEFCVKFYSSVEGGSMVNPDKGNSMVTAQWWNIQGIPGKLGNLTKGEYYCGAIKFSS